MNDKTHNPQEKIEIAIDSQELRDEELEQVNGGVYALKTKSEPVSAVTVHLIYPGSK